MYTICQALFKSAPGHHEIDCPPEGQLQNHLDSAGGVRSLDVKDCSGAAIEVRVSYVVLAAGGIGISRLLPSSTRERAVGIGNDRDLVGRYRQHLFPLLRQKQTEARRLPAEPVGT